jgi:hypothetical protein
LYRESNIPARQINRPFSLIWVTNKVDRFASQPHTGSEHQKARVEATAQ